MITKRDFILRGSYFCEKCNNANVTKSYLQVKYTPNYHRCQVLKPGYLPKISGLFSYTVPFIIILLIYTILLVHIIRQRSFSASLKMLQVSTAIILSSLLWYTPTLITIFFGLKLEYKAAQILTVTMFYTGSLVNPFLYFLTHPSSRAYFQAVLGLKHDGRA